MNSLRSKKTGQFKFGGLFSALFSQPVPVKIANAPLTARGVQSGPKERLNENGFRVEIDEPAVNSILSCTMDSDISLRSFFLNAKTFLLLRIVGLRLAPVSQGGFQGTLSTPRPNPEVSISLHHTITSLTDGMRNVGSRSGRTTE